jgi:hypothetical protein
LEPEPTPLDRVKQKRQDDAANQAESAKTQSIIDAIKTSGGDTKDSVTSAMHDLLLATLVAKDPRLAQVSSDLGKLLESIAKASENVSNSGLDVLPKTFGSLIEALKAMPAEVAKTDRSPELIPYLQEVTKAVKGVKTVVTPNVVARVDLSSINGLLERVEKAVKDSKVEIPTTDLSAVESAVKSVEKSIKNLSFPVPNYILPFKDPATGKATQVTLTASGEVPISGTISVDTTGLATEAKQDVGNTSLDNIDDKTPALGQALAAGSVPVVLTASQLTTLTPPAAITGFSTLAEQQTQTTALQLIDDTVAVLGTATYTEATSKGLVMGAVRRDADTTLVGTTNEVAPLQVDAAGRLKVEAFSGETLPVSLASVPSHAVTNAGTFATQVDGAALTALQLIDDTIFADDAAFTLGTSKGGVAAGIAVETDGTDPTTVSAEGDAAALRTDRQRVLLVNPTPPRHWSVSADYASAQTNTSVVASPGAGLKLYITDIAISNGATAGNITLLNGSGGSVLYEIYPAINGGAVDNRRTPIVLSAATALCITSTTVTTHSVNISGYIAP